MIIGDTFGYNSTGSGEHHRFARAAARAEAKAAGKAKAANKEHRRDSRPRWQCTATALKPCIFATLSKHDLGKLKRIKKMEADVDKLWHCTLFHHYGHKRQTMQKPCYAEIRARLGKTFDNSLKDVSHISKLSNKMSQWWREDLQRFNPGGDLFEFEHFSNMVQQV